MPIVNQRRELAFMEIINRALRHHGGFAQPALWPLAGFTRAGSSADQLYLENRF
jgi:hypothetical protein